MKIGPTSLTLLGWAWLAMLLGNWWTESSWLSPNTPAVTWQPNCAGLDSEIDLCLACPEASTSLNFMHTLNGTPQPGGKWIDDMNTGVDLADSTQVELGSLPHGSYSFSYCLPATTTCPADTARLTIRIDRERQISCVSQLNISVDGTCNYQLQPSELLADSTACSDKLSVLLFDAAGNFLGNTIRPAQAGQRLQALLALDDCQRIICESEVNVLDSEGPQIDTVIWPAERSQLICHDVDRIIDDPRTWRDSTFKYWVGAVYFTDNCALQSVTASDRIEYGDCDSVYAKLYRTFTATDLSGRRVDTTLCINFHYPEFRLQDISDLEDFSVQSCNPTIMDTPDTYPYILNAFGDTIYLTENGCDYSIGFEDVAYGMECGEGRRVDRTVKLFNWCKDEPALLIDSLSIYIGDFEGPELIPVAGADTTVLSTDPATCTATLRLTPGFLEQQFAARLTDCSANLRITGTVLTLDTVEYLPIDYPSSSAAITGIPVGKHAALLSARDDCGNLQRYDTLFFQVVDQRAPIMTCNDSLHLTLDNSGVARLYATDIDEGSRDNCTLQQLLIRRYVPPACRFRYDYDKDGILLGDELDEDGFTRLNDSLSAGNYVELYCCDVQESPTVQLVGIDARGNRSFCESRIVVEDKGRPQCQAPADTALSCLDFRQQDLNLLGAATLLRNECGAAIIESLPPIEEINQCGIGSIRRRWQAVKNAGTTREIRSEVCEQQVQIELRSDYQLCFPADMNTSCGATPDVVDLQISEQACDLLAVNVRDERFDPEGGECYKIFRHYEVINWCAYDGSAAPVLIPRDADANGIPGDEPVCVLVRPNGVSYIDADTSEFNIVPSAKGFWFSSEERPGYQSRGYWTYRQTIKVFDYQRPRIQEQAASSYCMDDLVAARDCRAPVRFNFQVEDNCSDDLEVRVYWDAFNEGELQDISFAALDGSYPNYAVRTRLPIGEHTLLLEANDGCGNLTQTFVPIEARDCKAPAPTCTGGISAELALVVDPEIRGSTTVKASDFVRSPVYDCSGAGPQGLVTTYSINRTGAAVDRQQDSLTLTCADAGTYVEVEIHAWDAAGNHDFCTAYINVQDNGSICEGPPEDASITGTVRTPQGKPVKGIEVVLTGDYEASAKTDERGQFFFSGLPPGADCQVAPGMNRDHRNGISTFDLIRIQQYILTGTALDNPYLLIAADVNASGTITTLDLIQLRKLVLNLETSFANNASWRFIDAAYQFEDPRNPFMRRFPEMMQFRAGVRQRDLSFIAVKVGDTNGSAKTDIPDEEDTEERNGGELWLRARDRSFSAGERVTLALTATKLSQLQGFQFGLQYNTEALALQRIDYGLLEEDDLGFFPQEGVITASWITSQQQQLDTNRLYTLQFSALRSGRLSRSLDLQPTYTPPEAYTNFGEFMQVRLGLLPATDEQAVLQLIDVVPNPFRQRSRINYFLPADGQVRLRVYDSQGIPLLERTASRSRGYHHFELRGHELPVSGWYTFSLESGGAYVTGKILRN